MDRIDRVIEIWKKTVDVQQHFNDLEMRIRNYAITVLGALLGFSGYLWKEQAVAQIWGCEVSLVALVLLGSVVVWLSF
jgi:hypothetical protein